MLGSFLLSSIGVSFGDEMLSPLLEQRSERDFDCLVGVRETEWDLEVGSGMVVMMTQ